MKKYTAGTNSSASVDDFESHGRQIGIDNATHTRHKGTSCEIEAKGLSIFDGKAGAARPKTGIKGSLIGRKWRDL